MLDALKTLFENDVVSAEVRQEIEEAWEAKIKENKLAVTAELREEFAQKYEHDKNVMVEAVDKMVTDRLESEMAELNEDRKQLAEAKVEAVEKQKLAESKDAEIAKITEAAQRKDTVAELISPLSKDQKEIMIDLLESVQTDRLRSAFDKYLPAVIDGKTPEKKAIITEGKEITGNREETQDSDNNASANVIDIRRLAGLN